MTDLDEILRNRNMLRKILNELKEIRERLQ
jgi:hypothetical protein